MSLPLEPSKSHDGVRHRTDRGSLLFSLWLWWCLCTPALKASWAELLRNTMPRVTWGTAGWGLTSVWPLLLTPQSSPSRCKTGGCCGLDTHMEGTVKTRAVIYGCLHFIRDHRFAYMKIFSAMLINMPSVQRRNAESSWEGLWLESLKTAKTEFKRRSSVFLTL